MFKSQRVMAAFDSLEEREGTIRMMLSDDEKYNIKFRYGTPSMLPIDNLERPPSPEERINNAGRFLERECTKGFIRKFDLHDYTRTLLRPALMSQARAASVAHKPLDLRMLCENEPWQRFWHSLPVVTNLMDEIEALPFKKPLDIPLVKGKVTEMVADLIRGFKRDNRLNEKANSDKRLRESMRIFVVSVREMRPKVIEYAITQKLLFNDQLKNKYYEEFGHLLEKRPEPVEEEEAAPKKEVTNVALESRMIDYIEENCMALPACYRPRDIETLLMEDTKAKMRKDTERMLSRLPGIVLPAAQTSRSKVTGRRAQSEMKKPQRDVKLLMSEIKKPEELPPVAHTPQPHVAKDPYHTFWETEDPLMHGGDGKDAARTGTLDHLFSYVDQFGDEIKVKLAEETKVGDVTDPFPLETTALKQNGPTLIGDVWNTADLPSVDPTPPTTSPEERERRNKRLLVEQLLTDLIAKPQAFTLEAQKRRNQAKEFMQKYSLHTTISPEGEAMFERMQEIWNSLGFSMQQRLDLVLKYTKGVEESMRLGAAVNFWEMTLQTVNQYLKSYETLRSFIKNEAAKTRFPRAKINVMRQDLKVKEDAVLRVADNLMKTYNDQLIIKRIRADDYIVQKRRKIAALVATVPHDDDEA